MRFLMAENTSIIEAVEKERNAFENYLEGAIPQLLDFCVDVILAVMLHSIFLN